MIKRILPFLFASLAFGESLWDFHPLHVGANAIAIGKADVDVKNSSGKDGHLTFNKANAFTYMLLPISRESYFFPRIEYNVFTMDWTKNPKFHQTHFAYVQFALTFLSTAVEKWRWITRIDYNIGANHFSKPKTYGLFSALIWGTHELHRKWHYHIGALGYTGFKGQEVYPIIGFDYRPNKKWMFQAVFPINYSIEYNLTKEWCLSVRGRPLKERFRTGKNELQPRSVFSYSSLGAEFNARYEKFLRLELEMFAGYNFGGDMYIKDQNGKHPLYTHVKGAPYIGANLNWGI
jgi:hypothetical protein